MLQLIRDLIAHKGHANSLILQAIRADSDAATDPEIVGLLHHILVANRFWFFTITAQEFVLAHETAAPATLNELEDRYGTTQRAEEAWIARATVEDLERPLANEMIPGGQCTVAQGFMQVCMHSHGHRAQLAKMLRRYGSTPPMTDFILWLSEHQTDFR